MAYYAIAPIVCALLQRELYMHLYINQVWDGSDATLDQIRVINSTIPVTGFGTTVVHDWPVTVGVEANATVVGHARGLHIQSSHDGVSGWYTSFILMFEDKSFKGSTLKVMGITPQDGQWSIIGGTGEFVMAQGVIDHKIVKQGISRIYELNTHVDSSVFECNSWKLGPPQGGIVM
ncbi:hypothetical protein GQ55_3G066100 [Panicum hallii var. hallii]|uniref:Dirigent protein n=1 Tax=Panicum hallii var. hallii TaxID=1504633 RepID=A0A2T7E6F2_9POAL|nr:hypothetical protein GQ55_3G066100 [Panicum hallii var. hallii]